MNLIFTIAFIIILFSIPALIIYLVLYIISKYYKISLSLEYCGFLKFKNINFYLDKESYFIHFHIDYFHIFLIWLKLRITIKGLKSSLTLKTNFSSLVKLKSIGKYEFNDSFIIKKQDKSNKNFGILHEIKEKFNKILFEKYIKCFINEYEIDNNYANYKKDDNDNYIRDKKPKFNKYIINYQKRKLSFKDKLLRNFLSFFDLILDDIEFNFKLSESQFFYRICFNKATIGIIKGLNVNKEIHFLLILNILNIKEYINIKNIRLRKTMSKKLHKGKKAKKGSQFKTKNFFEHNYECLFDTYAEFSLLESNEIFLNFKLSNGFTPFGFNSFNNTIELKIEVNNTQINLSSRAINTFMKTLNELSKYNHYQEYKFSREMKDLKIAKEIINTQEIKFKIDCNEEILLNMIKNEIKKIKLKLENTSINILSDNNNYLYSNINLYHLSFKKSNMFCLSCDESKIKLIKSKLELSLENMVISSSKNQKKILDLNKYNLVVNKEVTYYYILKESYIKTEMNSDLPSIDISINTKDLDKYIELMMNIEYSLGKLDSYENNYFLQTKYIEDMNEETISNISFDDISMIIYDEQVQTEINNCSFVMKMNLIKNKLSKIFLSFNPIYINAFRKYFSKYSSNFIIKGFELVIDDDLKKSSINIDLDDIIILIYDDFMIYMIKFISDFLTYNLRINKKRNYGIQVQKEENKNIPKKIRTTVLNIKFCTIYDYVTIKDLFTLRFENFNYVIDNYIKLPKLSIFHQNNSSIIKKKAKWFDITRFYCKFLKDINEMKIDFGPIIVDIYSFELIHPLITISNYYNFFPYWFFYHTNYKYRTDEDYKLIYIENIDKKVITSIKFEELLIYINQNVIACAAILQANPEKLNLIKNENINIINNPIKYEYNEKFIIEKLKEIKTQQIKIKIDGFTFNQKTFFEREINKAFIPAFEEEVSSEDENNQKKIKSGNKMNNYKSNEIKNYLPYQIDLFELERKSSSIYQKSSPFYNKLNRISNLSMVFGKVNIYMEGIEILNINDFKLIKEDNFIYDKFNINYLNNFSLNYKNHSIFYKEIKSHKLKKSFMEIYCNDMKLSIIDIKIIDKLSYFGINLSKKIMAYPYIENSISQLEDEYAMEIKSMTNLYVENIEAVVNSLDPITGELYNKLYLRINYIALGNDKEQNSNKSELTIYYFSFGFNIDISNIDKERNIRDYPLIILPLLEINIDGNVYRINIPRNYMSKLNEKKEEFNNNYINKNNDNIQGLEENLKNNKNKDIVNHYIGDNKLDNFILNTQSLTIFINYHYLKVFTKIFENLWNRSEFIPKFILNKNNNGNNNLNEAENPIDKSNHNIEDNKRRKNKMHNNIVNNNNNKNNEINKIEIKEKELIKMILTLFDLKIIYLINYQDKYYSIFLYHPQVKKLGYFGFIIRLYSCICKYSNNNIDDIDIMTHGKLEIKLNLLTITSLNENNLNDEKFFIFDKDILDLNLKNYKDSKNFNTFMEMPYSKINKYKALNNILFNKKREQIFEFFDNDLSISEEYYKELPFKFNETLIKMNDIQLRHDNMNNKELVETYVYLDDMKVTWNKMNMDMVGILIFEEILPITNSILRKLNKEEENNENNAYIINENSINYNQKKLNNSNSFINKNEIKLEESEVSMSFIINNFQICIENEITNSKVLISTKNEISFKINKACFNEKEKNFSMELIMKNIIFYIPPTVSSFDTHIINWIGYPQNNKFYILEDKFSQIAILPNVFLEVKEIIKNVNNEILTNEKDKNKYDEMENKDNNIINSSEELKNEDNDENNIKSTSTIDIKIDKLNGEFKKEHFSCFMNTIKVFIFNRGDSFAQEKMALDAKDIDLKKYKLKEIKNKIKENLNIKNNNQIAKLIKEIRFELKEISMTLLKNEKEFLKLLMNNLSGTQNIYDDLSSKLVINIQNLKISDLQNPRNDIILSQQSTASSQKISNDIDNLENKFIAYYENKIEMLRFRLKDSYVSIGTDSKWYVIQYLEVGILPLYLNISKSQCDFILEFFFNTDSSKSNISNEEYKKFIDELSDDDEQNSIKSEEPKNINKNKNINVKKPEEPFYLKNVKVNDTKLNISFFFSSGSPWNFKKAKIKLHEFEKRDKFYSLTILISRYISHLKYMAITNLGNILSSFFFTPKEKISSNDKESIEKKLKEEEEKNKKLLFGNLYNK